MRWGLFGKFREWRNARELARGVLGMNQRNLNYIYPNNARKDFPAADDKILTKEIMRRAGVPVPETYRIYSYFYELTGLARDLADHDQFVIKPAQGSGGGGIMVIAGRGEQGWTGVTGRTYGVQELKKHLSDIIFGVYSFDLGDRALVEQRIVQHEEMDLLSPLGLADVRVIVYRDEPVLSMTRLPTVSSAGRANLHQGAVGVGIDLASGRTVHAILRGQRVEAHPDTGVGLLGRTIPCWQDVLLTATRAAKAVPLKYLGVDISITPQGPVLLEINVRPGLEIQNANLHGLRAILEGRNG